MKLTPTLCKFHRMFVGPQPKHKGSVLTGKDKFVPAATRGTRYRLWLQWRDQEEVMKYISTPYITADEELDYLDKMGLKHHDVDPLATSRVEPPMRQRYATDILEKFERNRQHEVWE